VGAILGIGVDKEPTTKGYLHGQLWNRPAQEKDLWILFRVDHLCPWSKSIADIDYEIAGGGIFLPPSYPLPAGTYGSAYPQVATPQASRAKVIGLSAAEAGMPRPYDPLEVGVEVDWRNETVSDKQETGFRKITSIAGFPAKNLLNSAERFVIQWTAPPVIRLNNENPPQDDILGTSISATVSLQVGVGFANQIDPDSLFLLGTDNLLRCDVSEKWSQQGIGTGGNFGSKDYYFCGFLLDPLDLEQASPHSVSSITDASGVPLPPWYAVPWGTVIPFQRDNFSGVYL
jgi:hypothetical protein